MAVNNMLPVFKQATNSALSNLYVGPPDADEEHIVDVRACNITEDTHLYTLYFCVTDESSGAYQVFDFPLDPGLDSAQECRVSLPVPFGYKLMDRASSNLAVHVTVTGRKKETT